MIAFAQFPDTWHTLADALNQSPVLAIIAAAVAGFSVGFAARGYFQDRGINRLRTSLEDTTEKLQAATSKISEAEAAQAQRVSRLAQITGCLVPGDIRQMLSGQLSHWPAEKHDLLVVSIMRQLLTTPGSAWLCTPAGTFLVTVEWDAVRGACKVGTKMDTQTDPVKPLRELVVSQDTLNQVLFDVAAYGIGSIAVQESPKAIRRVEIRQGEGLHWHVDERTLQRIKPDA